MFYLCSLLGGIRSSSFHVFLIQKYFYAANSSASLLPAQSIADPTWYWPQKKLKIIYSKCYSRICCGKKKMSPIYEEKNTFLTIFDHSNYHEQISSEVRDLS